MEKSFEQSMERLTEIVALLESGEQPLEESLKLFEEGTKIALKCKETIENAQQKIKKLSDVNNSAAE